MSKKSIIIKYQCDWSYRIPPEEYDSFRLEDKFFKVEKGGQIVAVVNIDYIVGIFIINDDFEVVNTALPPEQYDFKNSEFRFPMNWKYRFTC